MILGRRFGQRLTSMLAVLCLLGGVPAAGRAAGEAEAAGQRIARVVVQGNERVNTHRILGQMRLREGSLYTPEAVDQDLKRIIDLREFDNVVVRPQQEADGLVLVVEVTERPILARLEFVGNEHFSDKKLA
ncbi:MAG TPA: POTRA domain-containing protein, partial [Phycisphaerae bacterium]|nr:POTRA domain-containing protein [Phycisphaerae bacterium]